MKSPNRLSAYGILLPYAKLFFLYCVIFCNTNLYSQQLAFPSAKGAAAHVTGGRGGAVIKVTNLNNSGTGSLRAALTATGPRIIVFDVSGTIFLTSMIELGLTNSNFTVAGQTAPEGGITIAGKPIQMGGGYNVATEGCNNAIWRYIRFRNSSYTGTSDVYMHNGFISTGTTGLIIDHCSFSFCDDQGISMNADWAPLRDITIQRCIFSENGTGIVAGWSTTNPSGDMTFVNNLFVDQGHRTPNIGGNLQFDIINNVFFNWSSRLTNINIGSPDVNYIGNYMKPGSFTSTAGGVNKVQNIVPSIYTANNYHPVYYSTPQENNQNIWQNFYNTNPLPNSYFSTNQYPLLGHFTEISSASDTYEDVLSDVGTNKFLNADGSHGVYYDSYDTQKISNVINSISSDPFNKNWTLPNLPINTRPTNYDTNNDGMPDEWKISKGFQADTDLSSFVWPSGYVGIEEFLNEIDGETSVNYQVNAGNDIEICEGDSIVLTASGAESYVWNTGQTTASITVSPNSTSIYSIVGVHIDGSSSTDDVTVTVNTPPTANAGDDVEICSETTVTLTASGGSSYLWNTGAATQSINVNPNTTTTYSVEVTQNGCSNTDEVTVTVNPQPTIDAGDDVTILSGESVTLSANGGESYVWNTGATTQSITVNPTVTTTYSVTGTANGCENTDTVTVFVETDDVTANAGQDTEICQGESVTLTATGGATYEWNTGVTTASITVNPTTTTTYTVTAYSASGNNSNTDEVIVTVNPQPTIDAGDDVTILSGESVSLSANGGESYVWNTGATTQSITVNPTVTTTYSVTGTANGCENTDTVTVFIETDDITANAGQDTEICQGESVTLTATGGATYEWNTGVTTASITVNPTTTTTYTVTAYSASGNNSDTDEVTVTVNTPPIANAGDDVEICFGTTVTLTASGGSSYLWNTGATTQSITVNPSTTTTYSVEVTQNGCSSTDEVIVTVNPQPTIDAGDDVTILSGESVTLSANGGESYVWNTGATTQSITVNPTATTTYSVTGTANGCENTDTVTVFIETDDVTANAGQDTEICQGESATLTATGGTTYEWNTGATTASITVNPNTTTTYTVTVYNVSGNNSDTDEVIVTVNPQPTIDAGDDVTILSGESVTLSANGGESYVWNTGATTQSITVNPTATTTYSVTGTANGCENTDTVTVFVETDDVTANAGQDTEICQGESVTLTATGGATYEWNTGATTASITVNPNTTTTYTVTVYNVSGNNFDTDEVIVTVNPQPTIDAGDDVTILSGESVTLSANGGESYVWNTGATTQSITVNPTATTTYSVTGTANGCENTDTVTVFIETDDITANAGQDTEICQGESVTLTATGGETYLWNTGATTQSITVSPNATNTYTVTVFAGNIQDSDDVTVFVNLNPNVIITNGDEVTILEGEFITLSATGANSYLWNNGATQPNIAVSPTNTTTFSVTGFINNCEDEKDIQVNVLERVNAEIEGEQSVCLNESIVLTAVENTNAEYLWSTGETTSSITVSPTEDTAYSVTVYNALDYDTDEMMVTVTDCSVINPEEPDTFEFLVYPNPTSGELNIKINGLLNIASIYLYDISGKSLYYEKINEDEQQSYIKQLNLSNFASGVYFLKLVNNTSVITKKIILN